jgi:hypothetical protein
MEEITCLCVRTRNCVTAILLHKSTSTWNISVPSYVNPHKLRKKQSEVSSTTLQCIPSAGSSTSIGIRGVVTSVQAVRQIVTCDEAAHILSLLFIPAVDCACHAVSQISEIPKEARTRSPRSGLTLVHISHMRAHDKLTLSTVIPPRAV